MVQKEYFFEMPYDQIEDTENEEPENHFQNSANEGAAKRLALLEILQ